MKNYYLLLFAVLTIACTTKKNSNKVNTTTSTNLSKKETVRLSFTFLGCNRVDRHQENDTTATNASTANLSAMKRIWEEISALERKPDLFFFLGDMVLAESTQEKLDTQLIAWNKLYNNKKFSAISDSNIEMVAIPGNHEMLYYNDANHAEFPLEGATKIWMEHMKDYMPKDREYVTGKDSIVNQMTFSFVRENVAFILMNTDTYNPPTKENPYGLEGQIPTDWIVKKMEAYRKDQNIEHIFVLGHKPYYVSGNPETGHAGLPAGPVLWPKLNENHVVAMLSAHLHDYQRKQPGGKGTYQVIAGNSGSPGSAKFFGYSKIEIMLDGSVKLTSMGYDIGAPYFKAAPQNASTVRDQTQLTWEANKNPYLDTK